MGRFKGWMGEKKTALKVWLFLKKKIYPRFHDVILPYKNGTSQVDHIIISIFGVFIIETKNKDGWIFGSMDQAKWTQVIYKKKFSFQNPLRQTYRQKKVVADFLKIKEDYIYDIVLFVGESTFKTSMPINVMDSGMAKYIKRFNTPVFSGLQVEEMVQKIKLHISRSTLTRQDHIDSLQERKASEIQCPKCGSLLVLRTTKKGPMAGSSFLGCSGYPNCKYSKSIDPKNINEYHKVNQSLNTKTIKASLQQWMRNNPGKSINDYYSEVGE